MNAELQNIMHPSVNYYDSDYPSKENSGFPENFDETVILQGLAYDAAKYKALADTYGSAVLEFCCGTGRISIPLAEAGNEVFAVDFSALLLQQFQKKLDRLDPVISNRITTLQADVTSLSLPGKEFDMIICAFNSLLCITSFDLQQRALTCAASHLRCGGVLALDLMNPLTLNFAGDNSPKPFFSRRHPESGNMYTRFAAVGPIKADQTQKLYGWYDEIMPDDSVKRQLYEMYWRPLFRYEIELMLEKAGFKINKVFGGHRDEEFTATSRKMFIEAIKL